MELQAGPLIVTLDETTGSITRILDSRHGLIHLDAGKDGRSDGRLFRIMMPRPRRFSCAVDSHLQPRPAITRRDQDILLRWENLIDSDRQRTGVNAQVRIATTDDEVRLDLTLTNGDSSGDSSGVCSGDGRDLLDVWFPMLGGWTGIGGKGRDLMIFGGNGHLDPLDFPAALGMTYARVAHRQSVRYPVGMYAPWVDLSGPGGGLSYVLYTTTPRNGYVALENMAGYDLKPVRLVFGWVSQCLVRPGQAWTSAEVGIGVHQGDWHHTADRYQRWMDTWWRPTPTARAHRRMIGYQNVFFRGFDGEPFRDLAALPEVARIGRQYGVDHLCVWDYILLGNYIKPDDLDLLDYDPTERRVLQAALRQAKQEGTNVGALINFRLTDPSSSLYRRESSREVIRRYCGTVSTESYPGTHGFPGSAWATHLLATCEICSPHAPTYRARVMRQTREFLELGFTSMFFDQPFEWPDYAHLDQGGDPERTFAAQVALVKEIRTALHQADPDAYVIGEMGDVFMSQYIDLWMSWYTAIEPAIRAAYSQPRTMHSWVVDNDAGQASHALALGMYLCLCTRGIEGTLDDTPAFAQHVARLAKLRHTTADRTVYGRFRHTQGLSVRADGPAVAYAFDSPRGPAVAMASPGAAGRLVVEVDRSRFTPTVPRAKSRIVRLNGTVAPADGDTLTIDLEPDDAIIWEL